MSYLRKISVKLFDHFKYKLSNTQKGICLILAASLIVKIGELVFKLIVENQYTFGIIIGIIILAIGVYLYFKRQGGVKDNQKSYDLEDKNNSTVNHNINTGGGNYKRVEGNYIQGDYINIQDNRVDMSKDITSILNDFRDILTQMQSQGYSTKQAVNQMAKELAEETRKNPYVKSKFHIDENADDSEVFQEFVRLLIQHKHLFNQTTGYEGEKNYGKNSDYKGHIIYLESDKDGFWWHYKINGSLCNESGKHYGEDLAIDEAKGKIDEARFSNL
ncbi:hypothetical protein QT972_26060 [Microcoleus sp. herbarium7]|uniref:hypothetical protein n=1 Tax=Microcoleus sp. herbarium7 TaxID=3055435 RepID=UPI002FD1B5A8